MNNGFFSTSNWMLYALVFVSYYLLQFTDLEFITTEKIYNEYKLQETEQVYGESYADEFEEDLAELDYLEEDTLTFSDLLWDGIFVLVDTLKIPYIAFFLLMGFDLLYEIPGVRYGKLLKFTLIGELVFVAQYGLQQLILLLFYPNRTMEDIWYSKPLSLQSLLGPDTVMSEWMTYLLPYIDGFEVLYVLVISWGVTQLYKLPLKTALGYVSLFYILSQVLIVLFEFFLMEIIL